MLSSDQKKALLSPKITQSLFPALVSVLLLFSWPSASRADEGNAMVRVACDDDAVGAEVRINGQFKGECPVTVAVPAGTVKVEVVKKADVDHDRVYSETLRLADGTVKRVEVALSAPQLNAAAQKRADDQRRAAADALAAQQRDTQANVDAALATLREQGVEPGNGKSFRDCPDCPAMIVLNRPGYYAAAMGQFEITRGQYAAFVRETGRQSSAKRNAFGVPNGCWHVDKQRWLLSYFMMMSLSGSMSRNWQKPGFDQDDNHPVVCITMRDAVAYVDWLSRKTGRRYYVPTAQWLATLADIKESDAQYGFAIPQTSLPPESACEAANLLDLDAYGKGLKSDSNINNTPIKTAPYGCHDRYVYTAPVGSYRANAKGAFDVFGNVAELAFRNKVVDKNGKQIEMTNLKYLPTAVGGSWGTAVKDGIISLMTNMCHAETDVGLRVMAELAPGTLENTTEAGASKKASTNPDPALAKFFNEENDNCD